MTQKNIKSVTYFEEIEIRFLMGQKFRPSNIPTKSYDSLVNCQRKNKSTCGLPPLSLY